MRDIYLDLHLRLEWAIQPVLSSSRYFAHSALAGRPTSDPATIERWSRDYRNCNWCTRTGLSGRLLILEIEGEQGWNSAQRLSGGSTRWMNTTQYKTGRTSFLAFRYWGQSLLLTERDFPGVRLHAGDQVLIPPSTVEGLQFEFVRIARQLQDTPTWLMSNCHMLAA